MNNFILRKLLAMSSNGIIFSGHGVAKAWTSSFVEQIHIPFSDFDEIIRLLEDLDYDFLGMNQVIGLATNKFKYHKHWVHLTFDDGYQNNFDIIYPYLKSKKIPFTIFVSTKYIESQDRFPTFWLRLAKEFNKDLVGIFNYRNASEQEIKENSFEHDLIYSNHHNHDDILIKIKSTFSKEELLKVEDYYNDKPLSLGSLKEMAKDPLIHIGSHSHHHIVFHDNQSMADGRNNINCSIVILRDIWKVTADPTFCYPNGNYSKLWGRECQNMGIPLSFLSKSGFINSSVQRQFVPRFWLSTRRKAFFICVMSIIGNLAIYMIGRKPVKDSLEDNAY